jgi:hypothetical protein
MKYHNYKLYFLLVLSFKFWLFRNDVKQIILSLIMKKTTNPYDILNSFPNNRPYTTLDKEYETKETISKKYGGEVNRYIKEPYNIKIQFLDGFKKVWQDVIINKTGNQPKQWTGAEWELKAKILDKESVQNKLHDTIKKLDSYEAQLEKQGQQINFSTEISTADTLFKGMKTYREGGFEDLCDYANNVLHEFEVEAIGIVEGH